MEEKTYYIFGYNICREFYRGDDLITEYYKIGEGWVQDKPDSDSYKGLHRNMQDAMHDYGDYSVMDIDVISEDIAMKVTAKQEELGHTDIPGLHYGSGAYKE